MVSRARSSTSWSLLYGQLGHARRFCHVSTPWLASERAFSSDSAPSSTLLQAFISDMQGFLRSSASCCMQVHELGIDPLREASFEVGGDTGAPTADFVC